MIDKILQGDVRSCLKQIEDESVQCCITSPPYWGLRDYGCDGQIGLEPTPEAYVADLVEVFHEVKRVLRNDGVLWLNLGDSYAGSGKGGQSEEKRSENWQPQYPHIGETARIAAKTKGAGEERTPPGMKPKDLVGIPWMVAFALRADGWYLRSDIIWNKPNPMPKSVTDRCTKSHEYIFMLTKSERYFYDAEAVKEPSSPQSDLNWARTGPVSELIVPGHTAAQHRADRPSVKRGGFNGKTNELEGREAFRAVTETRNKRDVWTVATQPCAEAHFATFPPKLIEPMILAGTSERGCCPKCGKPWERIVEHENAVIELSETALLKRSIGLATQSGEKQVSPASNKTIGWQPTCDCGLDPVPCTICDPFIGSGTTAIQAVRLHRHYIGCELNPDYVKMAERRIADMVGPLFAGESDGSQT